MAGQKSPKYRVIPKNARSSFFTVGKIFSVPIAISNCKSNAKPGYRRYAVVETRSGHSVCLRIGTYEGQATTKIEVRSKQHEHAIIYTSRTSPTPLRGESALLLAIRAEADSDDTKLPRLARLNYGETFVVDHTEEVRSLGHIVAQSINQFIEDFRAVHRRSSERQPPAPSTDHPHSSLPPSPPMPSRSQMLQHYNQELPSAVHDDICVEVSAKNAPVSQENISLSEDSAEQGQLDAMRYLDMEGDDPEGAVPDDSDDSDHEGSSAVPYSKDEAAEEHSPSVELTSDHQGAEPELEVPDVSHQPAMDSNDVKVEESFIEEVGEHQFKDDIVDSQTYVETVIEPKVMNPGADYQDYVEDNPDLASGRRVREGPEIHMPEAQTFDKEVPSDIALGPKRWVQDSVSHENTTQLQQDQATFTNGETMCCVDGSVPEAGKQIATKPIALRTPRSSFSSPLDWSAEKVGDDELKPGCSESSTSQDNIDRKTSPGPFTIMATGPKAEEINTPEPLNDIHPELEPCPAPRGDRAEFVEGESEVSQALPELASWKFPPAETNASYEGSIGESESPPFPGPDKFHPEDWHDPECPNTTASHHWNVYVRVDNGHEYTFQVPGPKDKQPKVECIPASVERQDSLEAASPKSSAQLLHPPDRPESSVPMDPTGDQTGRIELGGGSEQDAKEARPKLELSTSLPGSFPSDPESERKEPSPHLGQKNPSSAPSRATFPQTDEVNDSDAQGKSNEDSSLASDDEFADSPPASSQTSYESQTSGNGSQTTKDEYSRKGNRSRRKTAPTSANDQFAQMHYHGGNDQTHYDIPRQPQHPIIEPYWTGQFSPGGPYQTFQSAPQYHTPNNFGGAPYGVMFGQTQPGYPPMQMPTPNRPFPNNTQFSYHHPTPPPHSYIPRPSTPLGGDFGFSGPRLHVNQQHHQHSQQPYVYVSDQPPHKKGRFEKDLVFFDVHYTRKEVLRALLDTGATANFISEAKARTVGLNLLPYRGLHVKLINGHKMQPKLTASARWRLYDSGDTIWTDMFVVLSSSDMGERDVIIGSEVLENRLFLLQTHELNVLGLPKLSKKELKRQKEAQELQERRNKEKIDEQAKEIQRKEKERRKTASKKEKPQMERDPSPNSGDEEYHSSQER